MAVIAMSECTTFILRRLTVKPLQGDDTRHDRKRQATIGMMFDILSFRNDRPFAERTLSNRGLRGYARMTQPGLLESKPAQEKIQRNDPQIVKIFAD
jgi:hypothetical protein